MAKVRLCPSQRTALKTHYRYQQETQSAPSVSDGCLSRSRGRLTLLRAVKLALTFRNTLASQLFFAFVIQMLLFYQTTQTMNSSSSLLRPLLPELTTKPAYQYWQVSAGFGDRELQATTTTITTSQQAARRKVAAAAADEKDNAPGSSHYWRLAGGPTIPVRPTMGDSSQLGSSSSSSAPSSPAASSSTLQILSPIFVKAIAPGKRSRRPKSSNQRALEPSGQKIGGGGSIAEPSESPLASASSAAQTRLFAGVSMPTHRHRKRQRRRRRFSLKLKAPAKTASVRLAGPLKDDLLKDDLLKEDLLKQEHQKRGSWVCVYAICLGRRRAQRAGARYAAARSRLHATIAHLDSGLELSEAQQADRNNATFTGDSDGSRIERRHDTGDADMCQLEANANTQMQLQHAHLAGTSIFRASQLNRLELAALEELLERFYKAGRAADLLASSDFCRALMIDRRRFRVATGASKGGTINDDDDDRALPPTDNRMDRLSTFNKHNTLKRRRSLLGSDAFPVENAAANRVAPSDSKIDHVHDRARLALQASPRKPNKWLATMRDNDAGSQQTGDLAAQLEASSLTESYGLKSLKIGTDQMNGDNGVHLAENSDPNSLSEAREFKQDEGEEEEAEEDDDVGDGDGDEQEQEQEQERDRGRERVLDGDGSSKRASWLPSDNEKEKKATSAAFHYDDGQKQNVAYIKQQNSQLSGQLPDGQLNGLVISLDNGIETELEDCIKDNNSLENSTQDLNSNLNNLNNSDSNNNNTVKINARTTLPSSNNNAHNNANSNNYDTDNLVRSKTKCNSKTMSINSAYSDDDNSAAASSSSNNNNDSNDSEEIANCNEYIAMAEIRPSPIVSIIFSFLYLIILLVGLIGNLITLCAMSKKRVLSAIDIFIANFAFSDLMLCLFAGPITPIYLLYFGMWTLGYVACKLFALAQSASVYLSTLTMIAIAFVRYRLIIHPHKRAMFNWTAILVSLAIWATSFAITSPYFMHVDLLPQNCPVKFCEENWPKSDDRLIFSLATLLLQFLVPFSVISFFYGSIYRVLDQKRRQDQVHQNSSSSSRANLAQQQQQQQQQQTQLNSMSSTTLINDKCSCRKFCRNLLFGKRSINESSNAIEQSSGVLSSTLASTPRPPKSTTPVNLSSINQSGQQVLLMQTSCKLSSAHDSEANKQSFTATQLNGGCSGGGGGGDNVDEDDYDDDDDDEDHERATYTTKLLVGQNCVECKQHESKLTADSKAVNETTIIVNEGLQITTLANGESTGSDQEATPAIRSMAAQSVGIMASITLPRLTSPNPSSPEAANTSANFTLKQPHQVDEAAAEDEEKEEEEEALQAKQEHKNAISLVNLGSISQQAQLTSEARPMIDSSRRNSLKRTLSYLETNKRTKLDEEKEQADDDDHHREPKSMEGLQLSSQNCLNSSENHCCRLFESTTTTTTNCAPVTSSNSKPVELIQLNRAAIQARPSIQGGQQVATTSPQNTSSAPPATSMANFMALKEQRQRERDQRTRQTNKKLGYMVGLFAISWLPLNIFNVVQDSSDALGKSPYMKHMFITVHLIACSCVCYNPILYAWMSDNYRQELRDVLPNCVIEFLRI